jgi:hypothetical protein
MLLFPPPLNIGELEGFANDKDMFGRAVIGTGLTNLISSVTAPLVIAIDGQWGSGKTTFLKMWAGELARRVLASCISTRSRTITRRTPSPLPVR